jgi:hypothetical protein
MELFEKILFKVGCKTRIGMPEATIEEIESFIKFKLPADYMKYLEHYIGYEGFLGKEYIKLLNLDELRDFNENSGIVANLSNTLGIGGNGGNEFLALELIKSNKYRIVLSPFIDLDKQFHIEVGKSFTDFLSRLDTGQRWFDDKG